MAPAATAEITGGLLTVTVILVLVVLFPAASLATAASVCDSLLAAVVSHEIEYTGPLPVTTAPRLAPSSLNCTPVTPTLSVAFADTVIVPDTVAPFAGALIDTTGGVVSDPPGPVTVNSSITSSETLYPPEVMYSYAPKSKLELAVQFAVAAV